MTGQAAAFGARLFACRRAARLSQEELAEQSDLSVRAISSMERGRTRSPHPDSVHRLADALGLSNQARADFFAAAGRRLAGGARASAQTCEAGVTDAAAFGAWLRSCRQSAGLSQEQLAERAALSTDAVSDLERGGTNYPHRRSLQRLADALALQGEARMEFLALGRWRAGSPAIDPTPEEPVPKADKAPIVPRQLPAPVRQFVGRQRELAALTGLLDRGNSAPAAVVISAIAGTAGVGKTALALHWAHQVADRFPDGQLYVNLRGFDPSGRPIPPAEAILGLLDALEVPAERIPASLDAAAALFRSLLAGKRMLVVLDNARDTGQVHSLLPADPGCLAVVTSRSQLAGLVAAEDAHLLVLDLLTEAESSELLALRVGAARVAAEPQAAAELIRLCARLPLALAIAAAQASANPGLGLGALAAELHNAQPALDALDPGDPVASVRSIFSWSLEGLTASTARMFALLGLHPGPDITVPAAASLAGIPPPQARRALRELAQVHLISEHVPGRYSLHDLLRTFAAEQAAEREPRTERHAAIQRVLDHYLHTAHTAALLLNPSREPVALTRPRAGVMPEGLTDLQQALAWFEAEHRVLISAVTMAAQTGFDAGAWQLAWAMDNFLDWRGHWQEWAATQRTALAAATRLGDIAGQATARRLLGHTCARVGDYDQARAYLTDCLGLYHQLGDRIGEGRVHQTLGWIAERQNRYADALGHAEQALALYRSTDDRARQAAALNNVGWCHALVGAYREALKASRQALALHRQFGHREGEASSWDSLGYAEHKLGNLADAADCHRHALGIFRQLGDRYKEAEILIHLGDVGHTAGQPQQARDAWQRALDILLELNHPDAAQVIAKLDQDPPCPADIGQRYGQRNH